MKYAKAAFFFCVPVEFSTLFRDTMPRIEIVVSWVLDLGNIWFTDEDYLVGSLLINMHIILTLLF